MTTATEKFARQHNIPKEKAKVILNDMRHFRRWQGVSLNVTAKVITNIHGIKISKNCVYYWIECKRKSVELKP